MKVFVPLDSAAVALGADKIAEAIVAQGAARGVDVQVVRNGSRGMVWLEPLVEVVTDKGRVGFGPMTLADVPGLFGDLSAHLDLAPALQTKERITAGVRNLADFRVSGEHRSLDRCDDVGAGETRLRLGQLRCNNLDVRCIGD